MKRMAMVGCCLAYHMAAGHRGAAAMVCAVVCAVAGVSYAAGRGDTDLIQEAVAAHCASITATSQTAPNYLANNLIDGKEADMTSRWLSDTHLNQTVTFCFKGPNYAQSRGVVVNSYEFCNLGVGSGEDEKNSAWGRTPCSWELQGCDFNSADDADWTTLDTRTDVDWSEAIDIGDKEPFSKKFTLETPASFNCYRFKFTARCGGTTFENYAYQLTELKFWGKMLRIDITDSARSALALTTDASSCGDSFKPKNLTDGSYEMTSRWLSDANLSQTATISIDSTFCCGTGIVVTAYTLNSIGTGVQSPKSPADRMPSNWTFEGSNTLSEDDAKWVTLDTRENEDWSEFAKIATEVTFGRVFAFENTRSFRHYRFRFTGRFGGTTFSSYAYQLVEVQLLGQIKNRPSGFMLLLR